MSHHTEEEIAAAFARAPVILRKLKEAGAGSVYFELHDDASGILYVERPDDEQLGAELAELMTQYTHSLRIPFHDPREIMERYMGRQFCCGLVTDAREAGLLPPLEY